LVLVLNRTGKVEREVRSRDDLRALVAEYYAAHTGEVRERGDGCWSIVERFSAGEHVGWFVLHEGPCYAGLGPTGEDGPYSTREAARGCMAMHLRAAIAALHARR
jgi:hypothetical protein